MYPSSRLRCQTNFTGEGFRTAAVDVDVGSGGVGALVRVSILFLNIAGQVCVRLTWSVFVREVRTRVGQCIKSGILNGPT